MDLSHLPHLPHPYTGEEEGSNTWSPGGGQEEGGPGGQEGGRPGGQEDASVCGVLRSNKKQDFVKKNIEVCQSSGEASVWGCDVTWTKRCLFSHWGIDLLVSSW